MRHIQRILALGLSAAAILFSVTGCGSGADMNLIEEAEQTELTFTWWGTDARHAYTINAIKEFEKQNPDIKVNLEYSEFTGFKNKMGVKMAAHTEADVMQLNYSWVSGYSPDGKGFYDISKLSDELNLGNYTDEMLSYGQIAGMQNSIPIAQNGQVFIYNKSIYQQYGLELPKNWEDFEAAAEVMNKDDIYPMDLGSVAMWFVSVAYAEQETGKPILDDNGKMNFDVDDLKVAISFYQNWVDKGVVREVSKRADKDISDGASAGTVQWINSAEKFAGLVEDSGGEAVIGTTPVISGAARTGWYVRPATVYAISANTTHPKEAAKLLEFLVSSEDMALGQKLDKGIPFNAEAKKCLEDNGMLAGVMNDAADVVDATDTILMHPKFEDSKLSSIFYEACAKVIYGEATLDEAAEEAYNAMNEELG